MNRQYRNLERAWSGAALVDLFLYEGCRVAVGLWRAYGRTDFLAPCQFNSSIRVIHKRLPHPKLERSRFCPSTPKSSPQTPFVRIFGEIIMRLPPFGRYRSTPQRAGHVITEILTDRSGRAGVYYDEKGRPMLTRRPIV